MEREEGCAAILQVRSGVESAEGGGRGKRPELAHTRWRYEMCAVLVMARMDMVLAGLTVAGIIGAGFAVWLWPTVKLWVLAYFSDTWVPMSTLISMRRRKSDVRMVVLCRIMCAKAGELVLIEQMEAHARAGGHLVGVVKAILAAKGGGYALTWAAATEIERSGQNLDEVVRGLLASGRGARPEGERRGAAL